MINNNFFTNRTLAIATKHNKEAVIAPILEKHLLVTCITPENLDTDQLGTFSGEIERVMDPLAAARQKCYLAMERANTDLAVASEGSFGAHPLLYFLPADDELLLLVDKKNNLEIVVLCTLKSRAISEAVFSPFLIRGIRQIGLHNLASF